MSRSVIWGVDPGVHRLAIAIRGVHDAYHRLLSIELDTPGVSWASQLAGINRYVDQLATTLVQESGFPVAIALERPSGASKTNVHLVQAYGVVQAGLASGLDIFAGEIAWLECGASEWKKAVLDDGTTDTLEYCRRLRELGVAFENADEAAAYWIAKWADQKVERVLP